MPTMGIAAPLIEPDPVIENKEKSNRNPSGLTTTLSLASCPALSIKSGFTADNLPIGLQISIILPFERFLLEDSQLH